MAQPGVIRPGGVSSPKTPSRGQVLRAQRGAVGGRRKRCRKGKNCSAACIQSGMVCLVEFPLPVSKGITLTRNALLDYISKKNNIQPGSLQEKRLGAALTVLSKVLKPQEGQSEEEEGSKLKKPNVEWKRDEKRSKRQALSWAEIQGLRGREKLLGEAEESQQALRMLRKDAASRGLSLPRSELEMIFNALPSTTQRALQSTGKAGGNWWGGKDEAGNNVFTKAASKERGIAVLDLWLRQGGTDAYQGRGSKIWAPQDLNIEHVIPLKKGGIDAPSNWILARGGAQQMRNQKTLRSWIGSLPKTEAEYREYLSNMRSDKTKKRVKDAVISAMKPSSYSDKEVFGWGASKAGKAFGAKTLFTGEFQPIQNISQGSSRASSGPPLPFAKAAALVAKTRGVDEAKTMIYEIRNIWNKQLITDKSISPQEAYGKMVAVVEKKLTPEQNGMFKSSAESWASSRDIKQYGFL